MPQIRDSAFMQKRVVGVPPTEILEADAQALVDVLWKAAEEQLLTVGQPFEYAWSKPAEMAGNPGSWRR
jgi:hypothetical protein